MSNYTTEDIRDLVLEKQAEAYYGEIVLYFVAGEVVAFKDSKMNKKAEEGTTRMRGSSHGRTRMD